MKAQRQESDIPASNSGPRRFPTKLELEAARAIARSNLLPEVLQNSTFQKEGIEEALNQDYLIDYFSIGVIMDARIEWVALSTRSRSALTKALKYIGNSEITRKPHFSLTDISSLQIGDLRDQPNVGTTTLMDLIIELQSLSALNNSVRLSKENGTAFKDTELNSSSDNSLEKIRANISNASSIELLQEAMLRYLSEVMIVQEKEIEIWRVRLPWLTTTPETLASIGKRFGLTRERIRQVSRKAERYPFLLDTPVQVLQTIQNAILETETYQDFVDELIDCEVVTNRNFGIGILRQLALALGQEEAASDLEGAIYRWSQSSPYWDKELK
jgi:hypothetical protein